MDRSWKVKKSNSLWFLWHTCFNLLVSILKNHGERQIILKERRINIYVTVIVLRKKNKILESIALKVEAKPPKLIAAVSWEEKGDWKFWENWLKLGLFLEILE